MSNWKGIVGTGFKPNAFDNYVRQVTFGSWRPQFVVLHNTYSPKLADWAKAPGAQRMQNLAHYYRDTLGWSAGPHLFVADDLIWVFTPLITSGVHSPSWNRLSWGVEMVGDYDTEPFGKRVRDNAVNALVSLHAVLGLDPATLHLHKEDPLTTHKSCPGAHVDKADVIERVTRGLAERYGGEHPSDRPA